jgi:multiple sugar transport system permease protein
VRRSFSRAPLGFVGPAVAGLTVVLVFPLTYSLWLSFHRATLTGELRWIGLANYREALVDAGFWHSVWVTLIYTALALVIQLTLGLALTLLLHSRWAFVPHLWRAVFLLPLLLSPVVLSAAWRVYLSPEFGIVTYLLSLVGVEPRAWAMNVHTALWTVIALEVWHRTSYVILLVSAGLAGLSPDYYEAAAIDGASGWRRLRHITLPLLRPILVVICSFQAIELVRVFTNVYLVTGGGPGRLTEVLSVRIFTTAFDGLETGLAAALSYLMLLLSLLLVFPFMRVRDEAQV